MNKKIVILTAAMAVALTACGPKEQEDEPDVKSPPSPTTTVSAEPVPMPENTPQAPETAEPAETPAESAQPEVPQESEAVLPPAESAAPDQSADPLATPEATASRGDDVPTDEEVLAKYREADEAYQWFAVCSLPGDPEDSKMVDDFLYTRVADPRFPTMSSFRAYLKTLFSDEIVDGLLPYDGRQYMEIDDALYVSEGARGGDMTKGGITLVVLWPEGEHPSSCTVQATVELLDWPEDSTEPVVVGEQTYDFPLQKVGEKWVFTQFESII